jgi:hypothetical protein
MKIDSSYTPPIDHDFPNLRATIKKAETKLGLGFGCRGAAAEHQASKLALAGSGHS